MDFADYLYFIRAIRFEKGINAQLQPSLRLAGRNDANRHCRLKCDRDQSLGM